MLNKLIRSKFLQCVPVGNEFIVYHSLFGNPQVVDEVGKKVLDVFAKPISRNKLPKVCRENQDILDLFLSLHFVILEDFHERRYLKIKQRKQVRDLKQGKLVKNLSLVMSEGCNFACTYCIAGCNSNVSNRCMSFETAQKAIDYFFLHLEKIGRKEAYVNFGGGEPLLNWEVIKLCLEYIKKKYSDGFKIKLSLNTNLSLVTREIARVLKEYSVAVANSLDGTKEANDAVRKNRAGKGTFESITKAMKIFAEVDYPLSGFATTVSAQNFDLINESLVDFALKWGFNDLRLDLDVVHLQLAKIQDAIDKILTIKKYAKSKNVSLTGFWERATENFNSSPLETSVTFCGAVSGSSLCVKPNGKIFLCGYSQTEVGDIWQGVDFAKGKYFQIASGRLPGRNERCYDCEIESFCGGGCYITEEFMQSGGESAFRQNCELYRVLTKEFLKELI